MSLFSQCKDRTAVRDSSCLCSGWFVKSCDASYSGISNLVDLLLTSDGHSAIGAHGLSKIGHLICVRHLFRSTAGTNPTFLEKGLIILRTCATCSVLPSNMSPMVQDKVNTRVSGGVDPDSTLEKRIRIENNPGCDLRFTLNLWSFI